jgi:hypothetical protein
MGYGALRGWLIGLAVLWLAFFIAAAAYIIFAGPVTPEILEEEEARLHAAQRQTRVEAARHAASISSSSGRRSGSRSKRTMSMPRA